ncbi:MAG: glycosyltransferase [Clostridia bacterium]|nr:glycosyltransferase [Clostridia bacterium]
MKKILYINVTYKNASTGRIINDIVKGGDNDKFDYRVVFQVGGNADSNSFQFEKKFENVIRRGVHKFFGNVGFVTVSQTKRMIEEIKRYNPDLIHIHTVHHQCTDYMQLFKFLRDFGKPVVYTLHDCWAFTGGCYHYTEQGCSGFKKDCSCCPKNSDELECSPRKTSQELKEKTDLYKSFKHICFVGVSEWMCAEAKKSLIGQLPIICIRNGVDTEIFKDLKHHEKIYKLKSKLLGEKKHLVLGVASAWSEKKGLSSFYRFAEKLGNDYRVLLVGGNLPSQRPVIDNLTFYGRTDNVEELADIYNCADVLVNLSVEESFGLVTAEAAACGTPVIAYDSTANSELIKMTGGRLISLGDEMTFIEEIERICNRSKPSENLSEIRASVSKERMVREYWELYNSIL